MNRGKRKWYTKEEYNNPLELFESGDGSMIEVAAKPAPNKENALLLTRLWPDGRKSEIHFVPGSEFSNKLYISVVDPAPPPTKIQQERISANAAALANGTYRPPHAVLSIVPGNKNGDGYDVGTDKTFQSREEFNLYYRQNNLEKGMTSDAKNMHLKTPPKPTEEAGRVAVYDVSKGPPTPSGYEGVPFYSK